ncbi:hypothetical protein GIB67_039604 [Kingdonia uniflora]|uniref:GTD-binding domain-containing protein n=1 Tax=Kingdonia uniflora TaxID=39325 RepID=A0A7J7P6J0_9MAGN|nr:hypothetical protein GIB67_039604 [Kingdonia uniflora]
MFTTKNCTSQYSTRDQFIEAYFGVWPRDADWSKHVPVPSFDIDKPHDTTSSNSSAWTVSVGHGHVNVSGSCDIDEAYRNKCGENIEPRNAVIPSMSRFRNIQGVGVSRETLDVAGLDDGGTSVIQSDEVWKISIERNESGFESLDGSIVSEIEGEGAVDRLKRQVEHDRKSMSACIRNLKKEEKASAIAANEAMAMITRLQEEKASLHLEALQYLRMMEEQAEYDVEALQKANDLLSEREKDIQDLEAELEFYQINYQTNRTWRRQNWCPIQM